MFNFSDPENRDWDGLINHLSSLQVTPPRESLDLLRLRRKFTELSGFEIPTGGNTVGTEEGRMVRLAMRELGFEGQSECMDYGWDCRYGKNNQWGKWVQKHFGNSIIGEYEAAIEGLEATR